MTIISSQHYLDDKIVAAKVEALAASGATNVIIPCSYVGVIDGEDYAIVVDGHHTMAAARQLGLSVEYEVAADSEGLEGERLLETRYMDGDYYYVTLSNPAVGQFALVW